MYLVAVRREFVAQHFLFGGDWGSENELHSHHYRVEVSIEGPNLDEHGFLLDITKIDALINEKVAYLNDKNLNDLPEFTGLNPSMERLANYFCLFIIKTIGNPAISQVLVKIWEDENVWASYRQDVSCI
jgi:6-pyruvoyltetrahydropterin/6-carboxytetrahydropterin synthase